MSNEVYRIKKDTLIDIADAIRTQEESEDAISVEDFAQRILDLVGGGMPFEVYVEDFIPSKNYSSVNEIANESIIDFKPQILLLVDKGAVFDEELLEYSIPYQRIISISFSNNVASQYASFGSAYSANAYPYPNGQSYGRTSSSDTIENNEDGTYSVKLRGSSAGLSFAKNRTYRLIVIGKFLLDEIEDGE